MLWFSPVNCRRDMDIYFLSLSSRSTYLTLWLSFIYLLPTPKLLMFSFPCHLSLILMECRHFFSEFSIRRLLSLHTEWLILICSRYSHWWDSKPKSAISVGKSLFNRIRKHRPTPFTWKHTEVCKGDSTEICPRPVTRDENSSEAIKQRTVAISERYIRKKKCIQLIF
jgi:hypothetical protein